MQLQTRLVRHAPSHIRPVLSVFNDVSILFQIVAVAGRSLERAKEFAARFSVAKAYGSYEQLAQDSDVDIVYVGTINSAHYDCCMKMFKYNKHVLCEKPLTLNAIQTRQLIEAARSKKLFLME